MTDFATASAPAFGGRRPWALAETLSLTAMAIIAAFLAEDWLAALAVMVLWVGWRLLRDNDGLPILPMAMTFQWVQVTAGIWYFAVTGRRIATMNTSDYRPMVLIGLGCVASLIAGLLAGASIVRRATSHADADRRSAVPLGWSGLLILYFGALVSQGVVQEVAYQYPDFTQPILAFRFVHLALLFIVLRRLSQPVLRWRLIGLLMAVEIALGVSGYFAGFREPLVMAVVAMFEVFNPRRAQHWLVLGTFATVAFLVSLLWMSVRVQYRQEFDNETFANSKAAQMDRMAMLSSNWWQDSHDRVDDAERLVDRLWVIYYPALAVARVPSVLPHTNGSIMLAALQHILSPRVFFPTKVELQNDSEMVRKYSGVYVAGTETGTSIAFGYAAESYLDFGAPLMFLPVLLYGMLAGVTYEVLSTRIQHDELRAGLLAVIFWLALYLFERSWVKTLGLFGTLVIYLGGPAMLLDYYLVRSDLPRDDRAGLGEPLREAVELGEHHPVR